MDFNRGMIQPFPGNTSLPDNVLRQGSVPLPFYMMHPGYMQQEQEASALRDIEYLQHTYPSEVRRYQRRIAEMLDKLDYEGSMIYDEYPDRDTIVRLAETMVDIIRREEETQMLQDDSDIVEGEDIMTFADGRAMKRRKSCSPEKWIGMENWMQVLLCNEIYKRRHGGRRGFLKF